MELILIRHGLTAGNQERQYVGQSENPALIGRGRDELLRRRQRGFYPSADALYVSPLLRCIETARLVYPMLVPVTLPSLTELDFGLFEGKTYEQLKDDPAYRRWIDTAGVVAPPGGESGREFAARLRSALQQIADDGARSGIRRAAVVTHGGCILTLLGGQDARRDEFYQYQATNGGGFLAQMDLNTLSLDHIRPLT